MSLGTAIRVARVQRNIKQKDLSLATGISVNYLSEIELNKTDPRWGCVATIASALGVPLGDLAAQACKEDSW